MDTDVCGLCGRPPIPAACKEDMTFNVYLALAELYRKAKSNDECATILRRFATDGDAFWQMVCEECPVWLPTHMKNTYPTVRA